MIAGDTVRVSPSLYHNVFRYFNGYVDYSEDDDEVGETGKECIVCFYDRDANAFKTSSWVHSDIMTCCRDILIEKNFG